MNLLQYQRWRLQHSPADPNKLYKLELPWFGVTTCGSIAHRTAEKTLAYHCFPYGDKSKRTVPQEILYNTPFGECLHRSTKQYWKNGIDLHAQNSSPTYIDAVINPGVDDAW